MKKTRVTKPLMALGFYAFDDLYWAVATNPENSLYLLEYGLRGLADKVPIRWDGKPIRWYKLRKKVSADLRECAIEELTSSLRGNLDEFLGEGNFRAVLAQGSLFTKSCFDGELEKMQARSAILRLLLDGVSTDSATFKSKVKGAHCLGVLERKFLRAGLPEYISIHLSRQC
jgi:hypothetical protein